MKISVVIPCYNEEKIIFSTYKSLLEVLEGIGETYEIIFCNDGSTDNTLTELKRIAEQDNKVKLVSYYPNRGAGYAFRQLSNKASGEIIIHMDADLAMGPRDTIPIFLEEIKKADIVIGSRYGNIRPYFPTYRLVPSKLLLFLNRFLFGCTLKDTNSGFFAIKRKVLTEIKLYSNDFEIYTELFIKASKNNFKISEIAIKFIHKKKFGQANMFKHGPRILKDIFRLCLNYERQ